MADWGLRVSPGSYVEQERVGEGKQPDSRSRLLITRHGMEPKQLIEQIAKSIVDQPEMVEVKGIESENMVPRTAAYKKLVFYLILQGVDCA
jgi:hypothetical protein